jgi:transposase-like protein
LGQILAGSRPEQSPSSSTTLVISLPGGEGNSIGDWAAACSGIIIRRCPICEQDSIVGHGRRRKQAHDEQHDRIQIRRGLCNQCGKTFTMLPPFSLPYTHYSVPARAQAVHRRLVEGRSWESAAPTVKDPNRVADPSTLRRWFRLLNSAAPPMPPLRSTLASVRQRLSCGAIADHQAWQTARLVLAPFLHQLWPWPRRC